MLDRWGVVVAATDPDEIRLFHNRTGRTGVQSPGRRRFTAHIPAEMAENRVTGRRIGVDHGRGARRL
jgi:hypothetical protein